MKYQSLTLLGSTGSIGRQALELAAEKNIKINGLCARSSVKEVEAQARRFKPQYCVMTDASAAVVSSTRAPFAPDLSDFTICPTF